MVNINDIIKTEYGNIGKVIELNPSDEAYV